ncbi:MAG: Aldehyde:ferredoxin oxidoreductase, partial [Dehalococcoidia bacterium]|nr:Aldehyde:ferredoxin oxidoreductase [Dehalococcoidia bacterium]
QQSSIACIGPAGEQGVRIGLVLIDKCSTFGRSNAANFGSKNLKAIVVKGTKGVEVCHTSRFNTIIDGLRDEALKDPLRDKWTQLGLYLVFDTWAKAGYFIHRNQTQVFPEKEAIEQYGAEKFLSLGPGAQKHLLPRLPCPR